ncbi:MAG: hypothetical protein IRZ28_13225 [Steroidobacteraceae bacterium]|nr:hypothetical protein [Steroidobacteraceae bacterium]
MRPKLHLLVNDEVLARASAESRFLTRLAQGAAELNPVLDRLAHRHTPEILFAVLMTEVEDAVSELCARDRLNAINAECILKRLSAAIEKVRGILGSG